MDEVTYIENAETSSNDEYQVDVDSWEWTFNRSWVEQHGNVSRDELSREVVLQRAIKNDPTFYEEYLSWYLIDFGDAFPIYCRGIHNGEYAVIMIKIYAAVCNNLSGPHLVSIENGERFWVHSLTALRKKFLQFEDFVSFERSSFITYNTREALVPVRLKMIRQIVKIDTSLIPQIIYTEPSKHYIYQSQPAKPSLQNLSPRSVLQLQRLLFQIKQVYYRDGIQVPTSLNLK
jgi:hypothetical protein